MFSKIIFILCYLITQISLAIVELETSTKVANISLNGDKIDLDVEYDDFENGTETNTSHDDLMKQIDLSEIEINKDSKRTKRCIHDLFSKLLTRICKRTGCQVIETQSSFQHRHSWDRQQQNQLEQQQWAQYVQQQREEQLRQQQQQAQINPEIQAVSEERIKPADDSTNSNSEAEINTEDEIDDEEAALINGLKEWEHVYDAQLELEIKQANESGDMKHRKKLLKLSKNTLYLGLKRKILSIKKKNKRIRLLKQLTRSFKNVIEAQKKILSHKSSRKSRKNKKRQKKMHQ